MVSRLRHRDAEAWSRMVDLYGPLVFYWCRRSKLQQADAADILQNAFAAVAASIDSYQSRGEGSFRGWLWTITQHKIHDHFRGIHRHGEARGGTSGAVRMAEIPDRTVEYQPNEADDERDQTEFSALLHRGLEAVKAEFEDRTWHAFWRAAVDGDSTADIAAEMGITPNAVRQAKCRVVRRLRDELGDDSP
jgi:RNA polymerase sigma-70 factor (ECF subfamily)